MILTMVSLDALLIADTSDAMEGLLPTMYCCCLIFMSFSTRNRGGPGAVQKYAVPFSYLFRPKIEGRPGAVQKMWPHLVIA